MSVNPLLWFVCLVKGHALNGPDECHSLDGVAFFRWHCLRCPVMFAASVATATVPRRGGFRTAAKSMLFEARILPGRIRSAVRQRR